jgi:hypothetical protein
MTLLHAIQRRRAIPSFLAVGVLLFFGKAVAQMDQSPPDLARWGLHCFCITARHTPHAIIKADDNGQILWLARNGVSMEDLRAAGIPITESQKLLLRTYGLITVNGDTLTTAFPILGPGIMVPLRTRLRSFAGRLTPEVADDVSKIELELNRRGYREHSYAVVFGYALDGLLWDELRNRGMLPDTTLDLDHPDWRGAFWAIYPERSGAPGTNEVALNGSTLVTVWTDRTSTALNEQLASIKSRAVSASSMADVGNLPLLRDKPDDPIHTAAQHIATLTATALLNTSEGSALLASIPHASRSQAVVVLAHELIWAVAEKLVESGYIVPPAALSAERPTAAQLDQLMFLRAPR